MCIEIHISVLMSGAVKLVSISVKSYKNDLQFYVTTLPGR